MNYIWLTIYISLGIIIVVTNIVFILHRYSNKNYYICGLCDKKKFKSQFVLIEPYVCKDCAKH